MEPVSLPHNLSWVSGLETLVIIYIYGTVYLTIISIVAAQSVSWVRGIRLPVMGEWNILVAHIQSYSRHPRGVIIFCDTVCGWVSGRVTYGRHPRGVTFFGIIYSNVWMTPFSDEDFPTLETSDTYALWIMVIHSFFWLPTYGLGKM